MLVVEVLLFSEAWNIHPSAGLALGTPSYVSPII